ncbi:MULTISPECIES: LuxR C-terminal-related transcriptional regulator [Vibrio]|uniref:DNA-binding response regulator n=1 Tax=Vibrio alfacsensis TaxID=1074311 RepID=A0ABM6YR63_9VIBR|nr:MULTISPECIES: LuxR C-terminal-related transcriptional regulator [Vibrio]AXY00180.1 DNA-binding response regulator [Vibrio alfacsensis]WQE75917.1 LuxR C-terminal-related transcriptional regulator [Vibrio alfacsensis]CAE6890090.1 COG2197 Response regulator containing a CheY-like receiver domain and an HTH DNA-binding domain [Vibrio sp. B1REV9]BBM63659.1 helix-turn-helix transcriptional regulator [Vibrio alfacsensis]BCN25205.1 helix-turn-helix transcriptional regulator [Vibrio alfacsensis]
MKKSAYARKLFLVSVEKHAERKVEAIEKYMDIEIPVITTDALMEANPTHRNKILVIDYAEHKYLIQSIKNLPLIWKNFETVVFNVPKRLTTDDLLTLGQLKGIFYQYQSTEQVGEGLMGIINGQNWLPRNVTSQLLHYYRNVINTHTAPATVDLTIRELQVLRCLQAGSSNIQMAEDLFVSEFTIKSHLYQIFKKLSVKNRVQAIAWADQNLMS